MAAYGVFSGSTEKDIKSFLNEMVVFVRTSVIPWRRIVVIDTQSTKL